LICGCSRAPEVPLEIHHPSKYEPKGRPWWIILAESDVIVHGTGRVPIGKFKREMKSNAGAYLEVSIDNSSVLKGSIVGTPSFKYWLSSEYYLTDKLVNADGRDIIAFLVTVDEKYSDPPGINYYSLHYGCLVDPDSLLIDTLSRMVTSEKKLLDFYNDLLSDVTIPYMNEMKSLIQNTTVETKAQKAFEAIEGLGTAGVPAMIYLMDDMRSLGTGWLSLRNYSENSFEGIRHYSPDLVVDAMAGILNQIVGYSFGNIHNGGTDEERKHAVDGWRLYLLHMLIDTNPTFAARAHAKLKN